MGTKLGRDGKLNAVNCNIGTAVADYTTLYIGLLQADPSSMDALNLADLVSALNGSEFPISANFYPERKVISFGTPSVSSLGAVAFSSVGSIVSWTNTSGSLKSVAGYFITNVSSGTTGAVLWVGTPDAGILTIANNDTLQFDDGDLTVRVD